MSSPFSNFSDASTANGQALWKQATKPLKNEFSGAKSSYAIFKKDVRNRVKLCMWRDLITYQIDGQSKDLIDNADLIPLATVRNAQIARQATIIVGVGNQLANQHVVTQAEFDEAKLFEFQSTMLHKVLSDSLSGEMESYIASMENQGLTNDDGPQLLKLIQTKARGRATTQQMKNVKHKIKNLKLAQFKWNVSKFAEELRSLVDTLKRNEVEYLDADLIDLVETNFKLVNNRTFKALIDTTEATNMTNKTTTSWEDLLDLGEGCYETEKDAGTWGKRSPDEERILALQARLEALIADKETGKKNGPPNNQTPGSGTSASDGKKKYHYKDWQFQNPDNKKTIKKTIKVKGEDTEVTYYWCPNHNGGKGMWVRHKPEQGNNKDKDWSDKKGDKKPSLVARQAVLDEEEQE